MAQKNKTKANGTSVDFSTILLNFKGMPLKDPDGPITMERISIDALMSDESGINGGEKFHRYQFCQRIFKDKVLELSSSEVEKLKACIGRVYTPLVVGIAWDVLDGKPLPKPVDLDVNTDNASPTNAVEA